MKDWLTKIDDNDTPAGYVDAEDFNSLFGELENAVTPFFTLDLADARQLIKSMDIVAKANTYQDTGTANTIALSRGATAEVIETLFDGMTVYFKPNVDNTGATTLTIGTLATKSLFYNGVALTAGFLKTTNNYVAVFDVANNRFNCERIANKSNLAVIDGDTATQSTVLVDADGFVISDSGIMKKATIADIFAYILTKDGAGSGLDADLLDGLNSTYFQRNITDITALEFGFSLTGDRSTFIDFHSDDTNTDYSARIIRSAGVNGVISILNAGTGGIFFNGNEMHHTGLVTGNIGTYALLYSSVAVNAGQTTSGANLDYASATASFTTTVAGTWRAMGQCSAGQTTVFLRIA